jgi:hypothetical protein
VETYTRQPQDELPKRPIDAAEQPDSAHGKKKFKNSNDDAIAEDDKNKEDEYYKRRAIVIANTGKSVCDAIAWPCLAVKQLSHMNREVSRQDQG